MASQPAKGSEALQDSGSISGDSLATGMSDLNFEETENYDQPPTPSINSKSLNKKMNTMWKELRAEEDDRPPSPPPLSLANVLLECPPTPWIIRKSTTTTTKVSANMYKDSSSAHSPVLPVELWGEIGKRVSSRLDISRFRSVCKILHSSLPSPTRFPLRVPPLPKSVDPDEAPCTIADVSVYSQPYWKGYKGDSGYRVLEEAGDDKLFVHGKYTPWWGRNPSPYDQKLSFISKAYHLRSRTNDPTESIYSSKRFVKRVAIVSSARDGVNPSYAKLCDLSIVALLQKGDMRGRLCLLRLRGSPESWAWDTDFCTRLFEDAASYRGRLCAIELGGSVVILDYDAPGSLKTTQLTPRPDHIRTMRQKYIFEDSGALYLALGYNSTWTNYKLNEKLGKKRIWVKVDHQMEALIAHFVPMCNLTSKYGV